MAHEVEKVAEPLIKFQDFFFGGLEGLIMELANVLAGKSNQSLWNMIISYSTGWIAQTLMKRINSRKIGLYEGFSRAYHRRSQMAYFFLPRSHDLDPVHVLHENYCGKFQVASGPQFIGREVYICYPVRFSFGARNLTSRTFSDENETFNQPT